MSGYIKGTSAKTEMAGIRRSVSRAVAAIQASPDTAEAWDDITALVELGRSVMSQAGDYRSYYAANLMDANGLSLADLASLLGTKDRPMSRSRAAQLAAAGREKGNPVTDPGTEPEPAPVAAAIITSGQGVLVERRNDKIPPWTFPAGEIRPGESPADCISRRVPEETGLTVRPQEIIGRRIHPKTGRVMIYMTVAADGTDVHVGDPDDLAEVRWASITETAQLMPDMFPPVRAYLDGLARESPK